MSGIKIGSGGGGQGIQASVEIAAVRIDVGVGAGRGLPNPSPNPNPPAPVPGGQTGSTRPNTSPGSNVPPVTPGPGNPDPSGSGDPGGPVGPGNGGTLGPPVTPPGGNVPGTGPGNGQPPVLGNPYGTPQGPTMNPGQAPVGNMPVPGGIGYGQPGMSPGTSPYGQPGIGPVFGMGNPATGAPTQPVLPPSIQSDLTASVDYLNGRSDGSSLLPGTHRLLNEVDHSIGHSSLRDFIADSGRSGREAFGRILHEANQSYHETGVNHSQNQIRNLTNELVNTIQLTRHLSQLEQVGGPAVQRARDASLLLPAARVWATAASYGPAQVSVAELLRDVRSGAFLQACEMNTPLPYGGGVRISREMAALIRTIEAIMNSIGSLGPGVEYESYFLSALKAWLGIDEAMARLLIPTGPALPARAGRMEIMAFLAAFGGLLTSAKGKPLMLLDGSPAKLGELLWFGPTGGVFDPTASDRQTMRLSTQLAYGFDAIFSLVASDGRPLALPIFVAIQAQVNGSRQECLFGQPPLSEGWMRALIERLKDSAEPQQNALGERLEVALTDGRFHLGILRGSVEDGTPVRETFDMALAGGPSRLLSASPAFC